MVAIHEDYKDYTPPMGTRRVVERLLSTLPPGHLTGLEAVVLTNSHRIGRRKKTNRVRGRKYFESQCLGFYQPATPQQGPSILIVVDNIAGVLPAILWRFGFFVDLLFARTVYHEVGHHLDATIGSPSRTGEAAADEWAKRLSARHQATQYPILSRITRFLVARFRPLLEKKCRELGRDAPLSRSSRSQAPIID